MYVSPPIVILSEVDFAKLHGVKGDSCIQSEAITNIVSIFEIKDKDDFFRSSNGNSTSPIKKSIAAIRRSFLHHVISLLDKLFSYSHISRTFEVGVIIASLCIYFHQFRSINSNKKTDPFRVDVSMRAD